MDATAPGELPHDPQPDTIDVPLPKPPLQFDAFACSDVGRVRKDNQDSGYSGPWLLAVCDGVGGAARGDIASGTAIAELRRLDEPPAPTGPDHVDVIDRVEEALHEAHVSIGGQVDLDPALSGTSTTATVALFDGHRLAIGHVGDSRAYLLRDGELSQLTNDHTFVQSLIDEGRITEAEARVHPHRNLILKAVDGLHDVDPDLFALELNPGDRLFLCSDGACGVLEDDRIRDLLGDGTPEFTSIEIVRASLDAGSSDNVTCVVADVVDPATSTPAAGMVVGAAANPRPHKARTLFRGHRTSEADADPGTLEIPAAAGNAIREDPPIDNEALRYAPQAPPRFRWARRVLVLAIVLGLAWIALGTARWWSQQNYYVGESDGVVVIYRGVDVPGLSAVYEKSDLRLSDLTSSTRGDVTGVADPFGTLKEARATIQRIGKNGRAHPDSTTPTPTPTPLPTDLPPALTSTSPATTTPTG